MASRARRPRVVWLPASTEGSLIPSSATTLLGGEFSISGPTGNFAQQVVPVVVDQPASSLADASLSDFEGSAYRLRRIVGKVWVGVTNEDFQTEPTTVVAYAGFIILRVDAAGVPLAGIGNLINYNPGILESERDPWIWRRSWLLCNNQGQAAGTSTFGANTWTQQAPPGNWDYGSVADGPHVDAKTARIVSDEERLFLVVSLTTLNGVQELGNLHAGWAADLRVLASMKSSSGNRRNASR